MMDIEKLAKEAGSDAWDIWRDSQGHLHIGLDGVSLLPELEVFANLVRKDALLDTVAEWEKPFTMTDGTSFISRLHRMADELKG
jgi:hypothetical protein